MYSRPILLKAPGYTDKEFMEGVPGSRIMRIYKYGIPKDLPYIDDFEKLNPRIPDEYIKTIRWISGEKRVYLQQKIIPSGYICAGIDPYYQLIWIGLGERNLTADDITDIMIYDFMVVPDNKKSREFIKDKIDEMDRMGYLLKDIRTYGLKKVVFYRKGIDLVTEDMMYEFKKGYEPNMFHIMEILKDAGSEGELIENLKNEFIYVRKWIKNEKILWDYLMLLESMGNIKLSEDRAVYLKPLIPYKNERKWG